MTTRPNMPDLASYFMPFTAQRQFKAQPRLLASAAGMYFTDIDGNQIIDGTAGLWCVNAGHGREEITRAVERQLSTLDYAPSFQMSHPIVHDYANALVAQGPGGGKAGFDHVFFTNSGAEAIECAIKTARRFHYLAGQPERNRIITFEGAFHGRTLATIAAGGREKYMEGFGPKVPGFDQVPFDDEAALRAAICDETAAILIETVQGEGGLRVVSAERLRSLRQLCDEHGLLLIFDEIQCGIGRTGKLFAHQWSECEPDIMAIAKGIGGGFPLGACLAREAHAAAITPGSHGTTFGGNPLAMAVGNAVLDVVLEPDFLPQVEALGLRLKQGLASLSDRYGDVIGEMRGRGLLTGFQCLIPNEAVMSALRDEKLLTVAASDNVVRLLPPLNISEEEMRQALVRIETAASKLSQQQGQR